MADDPRTRVKRRQALEALPMMMLFWFTGVPFRVRDMGNSWVWGKLSLLLSQLKALVVTGLNRTEAVSLALFNVDLADVVRRAPRAWLSTLLN